MGPITSVFRLEAIALVLQEEYIVNAVFSIVIALLFAVLSAVVLLEQIFHPIGSTTLVALGGEICAFSICADTMWRHCHIGIARAQNCLRS